MVTNDVNGIIISEMDYKESSKILTIFTKELGKISVMAQGSKKRSSKLFSLTNLFSLVSLDLNKGKTFYYIRDGVLLDSNSFIRSDLKLLGSCNLLAEIINKILPSQAKEEDIYELFRSFFHYIKEDPESIYLRLIAFLLKFVSFSGFQPDFRSCLICRTTRADSYRMDYENGGMICENCAGHGFENQVNREEFLLLNQLLYLASEQLNEVRPGKNVSLRKLANLSLSYLKACFELSDFNSEAWLGRINFL